MSAAGMPEPRSAVMILVDASWEDPTGTTQTARACMENRSANGACIRIEKRIAVGARLSLQWRWEKFSGVAKYCRREGHEYLVGLQLEAAGAITARDRATRPNKVLVATPAATKTESLAAAKKPEPISHANPVEKSKNENAAKVGSDVTAVPVVPVTASGDLSVSAQQFSGTERFHQSPQQYSDVLRETNPQSKQLVEAKQAEKERKHMRRKWLEVAQWHNKQEVADTDSDGNRNGSNTRAQSNEAPAHGAAESRTMVDMPAERAEREPFHAELLGVDDIYRAAGIIEPRRGYSIHKVVDMLMSEHLRGQSKEVKRAAVLMALDAAGITVDEVLRDAKLREEAIDSYEAEQRKQVEAEWARKAEENLQIQSELERVKGQFMDRLRRNLDGVAREKATFGNWLTMKQQEWKSMAEAVDLCTKAPVQEPTRESMSVASLAEASGKPV